jgi:AAA ATPase domain
MKTPPRPPTVTYTASYPIEFQQFIQEKSKNFVGREFVFTAITNFLNRHKCGYFTILGAPGSGKSAILAKYLRDSPDAIYYNAQVAEKNHADQFLWTVCTQLMQKMGNEDAILPNNATEGSWFLSLLLQKISDKLESNRCLIIIIDTLDAIDCNSQPLGSNLFYLPKYLPQSVYFLLSHRHYLGEQSGLLIETPCQILDLAAYPEQNRRDVQSYIRQHLTPLEGLRKMSHIDEEEFMTRFCFESEDNFMYLSQILPAIANGFYPKPLHRDKLPTDLAAYYQQHWQKMKAEGFSNIALEVLRVLTSREKGKGISVKAIAEIIDEDEYEVQEVLENWLEFLVQQKVSTETRYSFYHDSFRDWLAEQLVNGGIGLEIVNEQK